MTALDNIVNINISPDSATVPTTSTTIPLLLGSTNPGWADDDVVHAYGAAADMLEDGFVTTSPEYLYALALTSQTTIPNDFLVGRRSGASTVGQPQIDRVTVKNVAANTIYKLTVNGKLYSYTSNGTDGAAEILAGLNTAIAADSTAVVTSSLPVAGTPLVVTAKSNGLALDYGTVDANLAVANAQAAEAAEAETLSLDDLNAIKAQDDSWYALVLVGGSDAELETAATWIQNQRKRLFANTTTAAVADATSTDNLAARLLAKKASRSVLTHYVNADATGGVAAWVGGQLPLVPGTSTYAFKTLAGQLPDKFSSAQLLTLIGNPVAGTQGRNVNVYTLVGGYPITQMGTNMDGSFVDDAIGIDWLFFNIQSAVYQQLVSSPKTPYTDAGVATLIAAVRGVLDIGVGNGLLDGASGLSVTAPKVATVPRNQRAKRLAPTITFSCRLAGAIHAVQINGTVTV